MTRTSIFKKMMYRRWWSHLPTSIINSWYRFKYRIADRWNRLIHKPIYYSHWSRDCDMCESSGCGVFYEGRKAFEDYLRKSYEGAEGPMHYEVITKEQYDQWKEETGGRTHHRDRILEAYENGRGNSIWV